MNRRRIMWAVGPDDCEGWVAIDASNHVAAKKAYAKEHDCGTDWLIANRIEAWDSLETITPADWVRNGHGYSCSQCAEMAFADDGAVIADGRVFCSSCAPE